MKQRRVKGSCFCGEIQFSVMGKPIEMGYCHCNSCRHWSAAPVNAFTLWKSDVLEITQGHNNIGSYNKSAGSSRKWCKTCGGHVYTEHPDHDIVDIYAAVIPEQAFEPLSHVFYQEAIISIKDGLPKFKDLPIEDGGSGETLPE